MIYKTQFRFIECIHELKNEHILLPNFDFLNARDGYMELISHVN